MIFDGKIEAMASFSLYARCRKDE
jgi:hypothetical protein